MNEWKIVKDLPNWGINLICILLPLLLLIIMIVIFRISFGANFEAKDVKLNDNKGTWLRHVKAISGYQSELIAYIWDIGIYGSYPCQKDRDLLLMARIYNLWKENIDKFQTNMNPNDNINVSDK